MTCILVVKHYDLELRLVNAFIHFFKNCPYRFNVLVIKRLGNVIYH